MAESGADTSVVGVEEGDWLSEASAAGPFDLGYDYTFFCALHPSMRPDWAAGWARRISEGGHLVTLMFPVVGPEAQGNTGPPWPVTYQAYEDVLAPLGFAAASSVQVAEADATTPPRIGKEIMTVWRKGSA